MRGLVLVASAFASVRADAQDVKEKAFDAPNNVKIKVRMEGPYTADVPLQIVCYFKYTPEGAKRMTGAPVELDKRTRRRHRIAPRARRIRRRRTGNAFHHSAQGLHQGQGPAAGWAGSRRSLSLKVMERVGRVGLREAANAGVKRVAFAPLIRDQGNSKLSTGDVEIAVVQAMLLAYDTEKRLQKEGLAKPFTLDEWIVEAGPEYFDETAAAVEKAIKQASRVVERT